MAPIGRARLLILNNVTARTGLPPTGRTRIDRYGGTGVGRGGSALPGGMALRFKF